MLRKLLSFFLTLSLLLSFFAKNPAPARAAAECNVTSFTSVARPGAPPDDTDTQITITMRVLGVDPVDRIMIKPPDGGWELLGTNSHGFHASTFTPSGETLTIDSLGLANGSYYPTANGAKFKAGDYGLAVLSKDGSPSIENALCPIDFAFKVVPSSTGPDNFCVISYATDNNYTISTDGPAPKVGIRVTFPGTYPWDPKIHHHSIVLKSNRGDTLIADNDSNAPTGQQLIDGWTLPHSWSVGTYSIVVKAETEGAFRDNRSCQSSPPFLIETQDHGGGHECTSDNSTGCDFTGLIVNRPLSLPCDNTKSSEYNDKKGCLKIHTAIGDVNTQANDFVKWVLGFVLGISGGIVLIIIIISGYKLMTSQGDPEKVKNARDQLTAAIVGLLFIIFSLVILQLITKDILQLPGFGSP